MSGDLAAVLDERVAALAERLGVPGVACAVDIGGESVEAHHGVTHLEHPLPVDGGTLFQIASMSKPFAATVVMLLVTDGLVALDDPVIDHLGEFATDGGRHDRDVTVRHLVTHTTGWDGDELLVHPVLGGTLADAPAVMAGARQLVAPGTDFTYNNGGFAIAGRLVETVTGRPFAAVLRERILEPLGLSRTATSADEAIVHRVAMRHRTADGDTAVLYEAGWQPGWALDPIDLPVGGLISCTDDLLAWLRHWLRPDDADALDLSPATRAAMLEPASGWFNPTTAQGIGWAVRRHPGGVVHGHGGLTAGYCSYSFFCPELDLAAAVLTNSTTGTALCSALTDEIVATVSGIPREDPSPLAPPPDLGPLEGRYHGAFGIITIAVADDAITCTTERHPIEPGTWQPEAEPPRTAVLYGPDHAVVTAPSYFAGTLVDFGPRGDGGHPAWIRSGGRIHTRID